MGEFDFTGELEKLDDWKIPEILGGAHCGNGRARFSSRSITGAAYQPARRGICRGSAGSGRLAHGGGRRAFRALTSGRVAPARRGRVFNRTKATGQRSGK